MSRAVRVVELLIGIGLVVAVVVGLGTGAVIDGFRALSWPAAAVALAIGLVTTSASAARWRLVARGLGLPLSFRTGLAACYRAQFLNSVLPAGVLGDVHRAIDHGRRVDDAGRGAGAVLLERVAGQVVTVTCAVAVLAVAPGPWRSVVLGPLSLVVVAVVLAAVVVLVAVPGVLRSGRAGRSGHMLRRWLAALRALSGGLRAGLWSARTTPGVVGFSVVATLGHLALLATAVVQVGVQASVSTMLPVLALALLAMGLPVTVAGWGPREATMATAFGLVGLGAAQGLAASVAYGVLALVSCLPGAGVLLLGRAMARRTGARSGRPVSDPPATASGSTSAGAGHASTDPSRASRLPACVGRGSGTAVRCRTLRPWGAD